MKLRYLSRKLHFCQKRNMNSHEVPIKNVVLWRVLNNNVFLLLFIRNLPFLLWSSNITPKSIFYNIIHTVKYSLGRKIFLKRA